ncbi:MAG: thiol-disulfide isomerase/thioredoxin [Glaciecola sp.]
MLIFDGLKVNTRGVTLRNKRVEKEIGFFTFHFSFLIFNSVPELVEGFTFLICVTLKKNEMALTPTTQIELGFKAPDFLLPDVTSGSNKSFPDIKGDKGTLVMFICNHCPYVIHVRSELVKLAKDYSFNGIGFVAISSNDVDVVPADSPENMKALALDEGFTFPYLYDESQEVAKAYDAACTPDFALFDAADSCVYRGRLDGSRPGNDNPLTGSDMRVAIEAVINGTDQVEMQYPSLGCNIKWKK